MVTGVITGLLVGLLLVVMTGVSKARAQRRLRTDGPPVPPAVDVPAGHGTVTVRRLSVGLSASRVPFEVFVDDVARGRLRSNTAIAVPVPPGWHTVRVAMRRKSSPVLSFEMTPGGAATFDCQYEEAAFSGSVTLQPAG